MSSYLDLIESSISQRLTEIEAAYQEVITQERAEYDASILEDEFTDRFIETGRDFPQRLLTSFVVAWYSFIEQELLDFCEKLKLRISVGPLDTENLGSGTGRARTFLRAAGGYEIDKAHWDELTTIRKLRNVIVHQGVRHQGTYSEPNDRSFSLELENGLPVHFRGISEHLFRYLQQHQSVECLGITLDIIPSVDYCKYLVRFGKELFRKLHNDLRPR